jgi:antitoxin ParD1/3/4
MAMNVSLTTRLEKLVNQKVTSGLYHSASEVIRAGLRLLEEQDEIRQRRLKELRHEIALGLEEAQMGESKPLDMGAIRTEVRRRVAARRKA